MQGSPPSAIVGLRDFFLRSEKEKPVTDLQRALTLLQLEDLDALEDRFLATDAFLKPWAIFRDSALLLWPEAMPRATSVKSEGSVTGIARMDLLWFYTQFDEGSKRYDAHADKYSRQYTPDSSLYGVIDKREWVVESYEKHLYAWLLQEFKVGKVRNPWGFDYFELRSVCAAWEAVFVPIVNAVRASYDAKGRRHYGRLALFVEGICPSRLAFPENNVGITKSELLSPTPFRIVSVPKKFVGSDGATFAPRPKEPGMLTKKHYDETEMELRDVYPMYGGLVERPKFKQKMEEWLAEQRARADARKALERHGEVRRFQPQIVQSGGHHSQTNLGGSIDKSQWELPRGDDQSPIKRTFNSIRRTISRNVAGQASKELPKGPLHGVTRQLQFSEEDLSDRVHPVQQPAPDLRRERTFSQSSSGTVLVTPWPRPEADRRVSEQSVYTSIRNSNPFTKDIPQALRVERSPSSEVSLKLQSTSPPGAASRLSRDDEDPAQHPALRSNLLPSVHSQKSLADLRLPSYEGSGYLDEISLTKLHAGRKQTVTPRPKDSTKLPTRLPIPIRPTAYTGPLRITPKQTAVVSKPKTVPWPGFEDDDVVPPPVPEKSPERAYRMRSQVSEPRSEHAAGEGSRNITRIVSKANIRAAIGSGSRESSTEELTSSVPLPYMEGPLRTMSPGDKKLRTYNSHLFPRKTGQKDTSLGAWAAEHGKRLEAGGSYEMEVLKGEPTGPEGGKF